MKIICMGLENPVILVFLIHYLYSVCAFPASMYRSHLLGHALKNVGSFRIGVTEAELWPIGHHVLP